MAKLGDVLLNTVFEEQRKSSAKTTDHPIEGGLNITDHVEKQPVKFSISGVCVGPDAAARMAKLQSYKDKGAQLTYTGRYGMKNLVIENINEEKNADTGGTAFKFDMELKQVRTVSRKTTKTKTKNQGKKQPVKKSPAKRVHVVKKGDTLWDIAQKYYGSKKGHLYDLIYNANRGLIKDPDLIYPGWKITIP